MSLKYDASVPSAHRIQDPVVVDNMVRCYKTQGHPAGSRPVVVTLYEHECKRNGEFRPENPWLQLSDTRGAGEGTYQWHKDPREPNLSLPRGWVWCSSWGANEWEYYARDGWTGITLFTDIPTNTCTSRRMPWQRTIAYRPNLVLSPIIKGKELMAGMPNVDDEDHDGHGGLEQPPCALESEPGSQFLGIASITRITSAEQLSGMTGGMTGYEALSLNEDCEPTASLSQPSLSAEEFVCEDLWSPGCDCGDSLSPHYDEADSVSPTTTCESPVVEAWTCQVCTYEHAGADADFLACAMCHTLRRAGDFCDPPPEFMDEPGSPATALGSGLDVHVRPSMSVATEAIRQQKRSWSGLNITQGLRHQFFGMGMAGR